MISSNPLIRIFQAEKQGSEWTCGNTWLSLNRLHLSQSLTLSSKRRIRSVTFSLRPHS